MRFKNITFALLLGAALVVGGIAWAGDDAPAAKPAAEAKAKEAPATKTAEKPATATKTPMHSVMKWVAGHMENGGCPTTEKGEKAWRTWFAGDKETPLAGLRDAMVKDGWNADRTIGFFKKMSAKSGCSDCSDCKDCAGKDCKDCDKAKSGSSAPAGDATGASDASDSDGECSGCPGKSKDCGDCPKSKGDCPGGCPDKKKDANPKP